MLTIWVSGVASAIVDNIPFAATMLPVVQNLEAAGLNPDNILWWSLALGADLGGNATIIGASANVILAGIAEREGYKIGFGQFMKLRRAGCRGVHGDFHGLDLGEVHRVRVATVSLSKGVVRQAHHERGGRTTKGPVLPCAWLAKLTPVVLKS